jgi:hypothetical protein
MLLTYWVDGHHDHCHREEEGPQLQWHPGSCALKEPGEAANQRGQQHQAQQDSFGQVYEEQGFGLLVKTMTLLNDNCTQKTVLVSQ